VPLPDCIIASSNRFCDLRPFCDSLYYAEPQKWGQILPWEFPQNGTKEVEEAFLRMHFSETDLHMQGGAHGVGAGFRFLKHAWYSIAMWNHEQRIPLIATWWLNSSENSSILEDPAMLETLCSAKATPETFFNSRDIQLYGKKLLCFVVQHIQEQVKARQEVQSAEAAETSDVLRSASDSKVAIETGEPKSLPTAPSSAVSNDCRIGDPSISKPHRATSAIMPTNNGVTPFPSYHESAPIRQRPFNDDGRSTDHPNQHVQGRKRGGRLSSGGSSIRGAGYDRRSHEYQHRFNSSVFSSNGGFENGSPSHTVSVPVPTMYPSHPSVTLANFPHPMPGAPPAPVYITSGTRTPRQHTRGLNFPSGELHVQPSMNPGMFAGGLTNTNLRQHDGTENFPSESSVYSGFNDISTRSGDVRRSSFNSRGGGGLRLTSQSRGGRRGGRGRDSGHQAVQMPEPGFHTRGPSNESFSKLNSNYSKRRGSAYHENSWRSGSEHPQVENTLPQRVLSGPEQYQTFQGPPSMTGSQPLALFPFQPHQMVGRQGQVENHPVPARLARPQHSFPDFEVDERYIGADATHVVELLALNIPIQATEDDVTKYFSHTCDVNVVSVRFDHGAIHGPGSFHKPAFIQFPNHNVARRVLDLREVQLYGKPLDVRVPNELLTDSTTPYIPFHHGHSHDASGGTFVPRDDFNSGQNAPFHHGHSHNAPGGSFVPRSELNSGNNGFPPGTVLAPPFAPLATATNDHGYPGEMLRPEYANFPPSTPFYMSKGEPALSTVLSSNATPATSEPNTPRKSNKKYKKKKKPPVTPGATIVEDESGAKLDATDKQPSHETPVKTMRKKPAPQDRTGSSDQPTPKDASSKSKAPVLKDTTVPKDAEVTDQSQILDDYPKTEISSAAVETERDSNLSLASQQKSDATPKAPRSQTPNKGKSSLKKVDRVSGNKQPKGIAVKKEIEVLQCSSPVSDRERPGLLNRTSDSDHVDESFHTASATPPADKPLQASAASSAHKNLVKVDVDVAEEQVSPAHVHEKMKKGSISSRPAPLKNTTSNSPVPLPNKRPISPVPLQTKRPASPDRTPKTPKTTLSISVQQPSPSREQPASPPKDSKALHSVSHRSVSGPSSTQQAPSSVDLQSDRGKITEVPRIATECVKDMDSGTSASSTTKPDQCSEENFPPKLAVQHVTSASSIPPTPMTTYHTAPTTPAPVTTPISNHSAEKPSSQSKAAAKKGPSQTESFSMFGKKQQKPKKQGKGNGTLRGKPVDSGKGSTLASGTTSQNMSGNATPVLPASTPSSGKKPALTVKTKTENNAPTLNTGKSDAESKSVEGTSCEGTTPVASGQESPSKGGIRNFLGLFGGRVKSPSVSDKDITMEDLPQEDELMNLMAPVAIPQAVFNIDHLLQRPSEDHVDDRMPRNNVSTDARPNPIFDGLESLDDASGTSAAGLGISAPSNFNFQEMSKKRRKKKKKNKSAKQGGDHKDSCSSADGDAVESASISNSSAHTGATGASYDVESDNDSDKSSATMGRPNPPISPMMLTPSNRKLIEQRSTEEHILSPRVPRNKHVKKKSYSRVASSATATAKASPSTDTAASVAEIEQQPRILQLYQMDKKSGNGDGEGEDDDDPPKVMIFSLPDDEGNNQQVHLIHQYTLRLPNSVNRTKVYKAVSVGGKSRGGDNAAITIEAGETTEDEQMTKYGVAEDDSAQGK
jgi:hypothetical protein